MPDEPERVLDIRVTAAKSRGFVIWEDGEILAALSDRAQVAAWINARLSYVTGEELDSPEVYDEPITMPNVVKAFWPKRAK